MNNRKCSNCSWWEEDDIFDETREQFAGYCNRVTQVTKLTYEDNTCPKHRFRRGSKELEKN